MNKTVSVVIAVYNGMPYLRNAIESALAQTHAPFEVIVIDDGSVDETPKLLESCGGRIITRRFANTGVAAAMSRGLELATGDTVAFMDHDDVWFKDKLKKQVEALSKYPEAGFVCCDYAVRRPAAGGRLMKHFSEVSVLKGLDPAQPFLKNPLRYLMRENFVGTSSAVLVTRAVTRKVGLFNTDYRITGDYDYWLRCAAQTDFVVLPEALFYKRTHTANISADRIRMLLEHRDILEGFFRNYHTGRRDDGFVESYRHGAASVYYQLGDLYFEEKKIREVFSFYWKAWKVWPSALNFCGFLWTVFKKSVRLLTCDVLNRKKLDKIAGRRSRHALRGAR